LNTGYPLDAGIRFSWLEKMMREQGRGNFSQLHSVLIYRRGKLVFEEYFGGWNRDRLHRIQSVTKSVVASIFGAALDRELIGSVDDRVFNYFPQYQIFMNPSNKNLKIEDILTMRAGFEWDESLPFDADNSIVMMHNAEDPLEFVLSRTTVTPPGEEWVYSGGCTQLLAGITEQVTGADFETYARDVFFGPLGVTDFEWVRHKNGMVLCGGGLNMRPRDLLKIGILYLNKGLWNGTRVLSEKWVSEAVKPRVSVYEKVGLESYGYQWWQNAFSGESSRGFFAFGWGGQVIGVFPPLEMVVVFTQGYFAGTPVTDILLKQYILPSVM